MKKTRIAVKAFSLSAWIAIAGAIVGLAFAWLLPQDLTARGPVYTWLVVASFFGRVFTYHTGLALAGITAISLLLRRWRLVAVAAVASLACVGPTLATFQPKSAVSAGGPALRVMSINLLFTNTQYGSILAQIGKEDPDVVVMEEFTTIMRDKLAPPLAERYPFSSLHTETGGHGLALFSKRPFVEPVQADVSRQRAWIRAAVQLGDKPVAVYAVHPHAPLTRRAIMDNRAEVAEHLKQFAAEPLPIIAAGDWNFTSETPNAHALVAAGLTDAFDQAARGRGTTWPINAGWKSYFPGVRIDHVYLSPNLVCTRYTTGVYDGSDHLPIVADIAVLAAEAHGTAVGLVDSR